jgi:hypothetical protein
MEGADYSLWWPVTEGFHIAASQVSGLAYFANHFNRTGKRAGMVGAEAEAGSEFDVGNTDESLAFNPEPYIGAFSIIRSGLLFITKCCYVRGRFIPAASSPQEGSACPNFAAYYNNLFLNGLRSGGDNKSEERNSRCYLPTR